MNDFNGYKHFFKIEESTSCDYIDIDNRHKTYNENHCWQYDIRLKNRQEDLKLHGLTEDDVSSLKVSDFDFFAYDLNIDNSKFQEAKRFIERHEWLGKLSLYPTHLFTATYKGILCGVVFFDMPNTFSKLLGDDTRKIERLISRGACISFSPKNLASSLIMFGIKWSVKNTRFRVFYGYSDPSAKELGTIYQACNFIYLGQKFGAKKQYKSPITGKWVTDRSFRSRSAYKRYAKELNIRWEHNWNKGDRVLWDNIPDDIELELKNRAKEIYENVESREIPAKHKYVYILGKDKRETKELKERFFEKNGRELLPYPKKR